MWKSYAVRDECRIVKEAHSRGLLDGVEIYALWGAPGCALDWIRATLNPAGWGYYEDACAATQKEARQIERDCPGWEGGNTLEGLVATMMAIPVEGA